MLISHPKTRKFHVVVKYKLKTPCAYYCLSRRCDIFSVDYSDKISTLTLIASEYCLNRDQSKRSFFFQKNLGNDFGVVQICFIIIFSPIIEQIWTKSNNYHVFSLFVN